MTKKDVREVFQYGLASLLIVGFFFILYIVFVKTIPEANKDLGLLVVGALVAKFGDIVAYFFNSSKGSADKSDAINQKLLK